MESIFSSTYVLETPRLVFREACMEDVDELLQYFKDPMVMAFSRVRNRRDVVEWIQWNRNNYKTHGFGKWIMELKSTETIIGDCGISFQNVEGDLLPEIGYRLNTPYWKKGYALEAASACKTYAFEKLDFKSVYSCMHEHNKSAIKVAMRNGMELIKRYTLPGSDHDMLLFGAYQGIVNTELAPFIKTSRASYIYDEYQ